MEARELFFTADKEINGFQQALIGFSSTPATHELFIRFPETPANYIFALSIIVPFNRNSYSRTAT